MVKSKLLKVCYKDAKNGIRLTTYADTLVLDESNPKKKVLLLIRFGGDPEPVRAMADAIYGGGDIEVEFQSSHVRLTTLTKQYKRQIIRDGVYAEATLTALDDTDMVAPKAAVSNEKTQESLEEQAEIEMPPRTYYFFCPQDDEKRLFEDIDRKVSVPLIPEFQEFFLAALRREKILQPLKVWSCSEKFDAWSLRCTKNETNLAAVLDNGLQSGKICIPGAENADTSIFEDIVGVTAYLKKFGVSMANKIKARFNPLFDPAAERVSDEILAINANIMEHTDRKSVV